MRSILRAAWVVALVGTCGTVDAQPPYSPAGQPVGPVVRPAVSPYLNLLRANNSAGVNYHGLVRPQVQASNAVAALQASQASLAASTFETSDPSLPTTGVSFGYMTHTVYFQNHRSGGAGGGRATAGFGTASSSRGRQR